MSGIADTFQRVAPGFIFGCLFGLAWFGAFGYLTLLLAAAALFGGSVPRYFILFTPSLSILPVAVGFSLFRKHNVVSGLLVAAIVLVLFSVPALEQRALYGVRQSGKSFTSAAIQHFRQVCVKYGIPAQ